MKSTTRVTGRPGGLTPAVRDGLMNVATGMGGAGDKNSYARWSLGENRGMGPSLLDPYQVAAAYMTDWVVAKVHDIPPEEMTKAWRAWQAEADDITKLEAEEKRLNVRETYQEALREGLFGGGVIIMGLPGNPAREAPPPEKIGEGGLKYLWVLSRWQLSVEEFELDLLSPNFGKPKEFILNGSKQQRIHPSRVIVFPGKPIPRASRMPESRRFWGAPLLERINTAMQNANLAQNSVAELLHEAKLDILSIPGLSEMVSTAPGEALLAKRLAVGALMQSMHGVKVLEGAAEKDGAKEEWDTRQINFANLPETVLTFLQMAAGAADMPLTRLVGTQAKGLGNGGEADEKNFLAMTRSRQNTDLKPRLERMDGYLKASAGVVETKEKPVLWTFGALVEMSPKEEAEIDKLHAETFKAIGETGTIPPDALSAIQVNKMKERQTYPGIEQAMADAVEQIPAIREAELSEKMVESANDNAVRPVAVSGRGAKTQSARVTKRDSIQDAEAAPLYVSRKVLNPQEVLKHFRAQGVPNLETAASLHVTVLYSRRPVDWMAMGSSWNSDDQGRLRLPPGGPRQLDLFGPEENILVQTIQHNELTWRHEQMVSAGASHDFEEFTAHITISKGKTGSFDLSALKPYTGRIVLGAEIFERIEE